MGNLILVLGKTGTGKSRSIKLLDPGKTYIINCLGKDLPFKGSRTLYNDEKRNIKTIKNMMEKSMVNKTRVTETIDALIQARPEIDTIIIDDARHIMEDEFIKRGTEIGYTKFTQLGQHMVEVFEKAKSVPANIDIFIMLHTDDVTNGQTIVEFKAKLVGKLVEDHFNPLELATIVLFTYVEPSKDKTLYRFVTNRANFNGIEYPAKSPEEMFDSLLIENDLAFVKQKIHEFFN